MTRLYYLIVFVVLVGVNTVFAQKPGGGINDQSQDVIKNFDARLIESEKIKMNPILPLIDTTTKAQTYSVPDKVIAVQYQPPKMRPIAIAIKKTEPGYNGYAKIGYGFPNSPYGELNYRYNDPGNFILGGKVKYFAMDNATIANQSFSNLNLEGNGTFFAKDLGLAVDGTLGYNTDVRNYYGYDHLKYPVETKESSKQNFNTFYAGTKAYNSARTVADINYGVGANFYKLNDNFGAQETDFNVRLEGTKWFSEKFPLTAVLRTEFTSFDSTGGKTQSLNNIYFQPSFTYKTDELSVRLGANLISSNDVFYPKPDIEASYKIAGQQLSVFAGWKGDLTKNTFRQLTNYNPYIFSQTKLKNTERTEYYGGIKGEIANLNYSAQVGYSNNNNLALYLSDSTDHFRRFNVLYDTVNIFNIRGSASYRPIEKLEIIATLSQNVYTLTREKAAWGLPSLDVNLSGKYTAYEVGDQRAILKAALFVQNGVNARDNKGIAQRLDGLFDINIGGEYWFLKNIGAFLDINNLLNIKRERWQYYPNYGMNILGGITARF